MLRIHDRYFLGSFIKTLIISLLAFILIFTIVDVIEKLDTFIDHEAPIEAVLKYFLNYFPFMFILVLPVAMLMASLFTTGQFVRNGEITAMKAAGISLPRIFRPVIIFAFLVSIFSFWFGERVVSDAERRKSEIYRYDITKTSRRFSMSQRNIRLQQSGGRIVTIAHYDGQKKRATMITVLKRNDNKVILNIVAKAMIRVDNIWKLQDVKIRDFSSGEEVFTEAAEYEIADFSFTPDDLKREQIKPEEMNIFDLYDYIEKLKMIGSKYDIWIVDFHNKIAFPFANLVLVLVGLPLATQSWRGGVAVGFGLSLFICFLYYVVMSLSIALGYNARVSPVIAAWTSNSIFGLIGIINLKRVGM